MKPEMGIVVPKSVQTLFGLKHCMNASGYISLRTKRFAAAAVAKG